LREDAGMDGEGQREVVAEFEGIAFLMERQLAGSHRVQAFRRAAQVVAELPSRRWAELVASDSLTELPGIGSTTATVAAAVLAGGPSAYRRQLEEVPPPDPGAGRSLLTALRGDLHSHSDWSDGGSPVEQMAQTARSLGREYLVLSDHSPRLTVARGLSPARLREQLAVVAGLNERFAAQTPEFRLLTGIEVDINDDGSLDQEPELLAGLDVVVGSVHSKLRMPGDEMTPRMVAAIASGAVDVLGHCTGRMRDPTGERGRKERPPSDFDAEVVFAACAAFDVAVEINCRPERRDPPSSLLRLAVDLGCWFAIDTDAHAPGQLDWLAYGAARAAACGVPPERVVTTWAVEQLQRWVSDRRAAAGEVRVSLGQAGRR
jgi:putative hydrolase